MKRETMLLAHRASVRKGFDEKFGVKQFIRKKSNWHSQNKAAWVEPAGNASHTVTEHDVELS
jgi:hypothetical protein